MVQRVYKLPPVGPALRVVMVLWSVRSTVIHRWTGVWLVNLVFEATFKELRDKGALVDFCFSEKSLLMDLGLWQVLCVTACRATVPGGHECAGLR